MYRTVQNELVRLSEMGLLDELLCDKTTNRNLILVADTYSHLGVEYVREGQISSELLLREPFRLMGRAEKEKYEKDEPTRTHAEVFTPLWIVRNMNGFIDEEWFGRSEPFKSERVTFPEDHTWKDYVDSRRMEITSGEAPFLVTRYDVTTGDEVQLIDRVGILDCKLRVVSENARDRDEWLEWAYRAYQAAYGYEFQGDNVILARLNLLLTFEDYLEARWGRKPRAGEYQKLLSIIAWNIWQMDGLTGMLPYSEALDPSLQEDFFGYTDDLLSIRLTDPPCRIYDWRANESIEFNRLSGD